LHSLAQKTIRDIMATPPAVWQRVPYRYRVSLHATPFFIEHPETGNRPFPDFFSDH
jgi:hypothetical protein